jgi:hypothetical protein
MKEAVISFGVMVVCALVMVAAAVHAGPTNLKDEVKVAQRHADIAKVADPDAGVTYAQIKADMLDVGTALDAVSTAIDAIDMSTIDPAAFNGNAAQKTCIQNLKANLNSLKVATKDLKVSAKNNMQATNKLVKKLKESERIDKEKGAK